MKALLVSTAYLARKSKMYDDWIHLDVRTNEYVTGDGTRVAAELVETACCLADVLYISYLRSEQRKEMKNGSNPRSNQARNSPSTKPNVHTVNQRN